MVFLILLNYLYFALKHNIIIGAICSAVDFIARNGRLEGALMINQLDHNVVLRNNVKKLGNMLGEILEYHGGIELFNKVETIREMTKSIRKEFDKETYDKLILVRRIQLDVIIKWKQE